MSSAFSTPRADEYLALLEERLPEKTFRHVQSVARFMLTYAEEAGITEEQAVEAGLLHDLCKALKREELSTRAGLYDITKHLDNPNLLHGPVGAEECRRELGIVDKDVLDAIRFHTTGRREWSAVGCALYLADFAEPLRTIPSAEEARTILDSEGYPSALRYAAVQKERYVREKFEPDRNATDFFEWIRNLD